VAGGLLLAAARGSFETETAKPTVFCPDDWLIDDDNFVCSYE
jgi:hypothetical protein